MRKRLLIALGVVAVATLVGAGALYAYDRGQRGAIARGITVDGIDIGGLTPAQARARLNSAYAPSLSRPIVLRFHGRKFVLAPRSAGLALDIGATVDAALARSRDGTIFARVWRSLTGGHVNLDLHPQVTYSRDAVTRLVARVRAALNRRPRDAAVSLNADSLGLVPSRPGLAVRAGALTSAIENALAHPQAGHEIAVPTRVVQPKLSTSRVATRYPTVITIDRGNFRLRLWKNLRLIRSYPIAVGMQGLETPAGLYHIQNKIVDPWWSVPHSAWAGSLAGKLIPPGPQDPIKARWMGLFNGAGIHGTDETDSIGHASSHGCVRMLIPDVIDLYDRVQVGTPVYIGD
jgi:lipoprotein-anchoring transpeptidase ErfK/SrfK